MFFWFELFDAVDVAAAVGEFCRATFGRTQQCRTDANDRSNSPARTSYLAKHSEMRLHCPNSNRAHRPCHSKCISNTKSLCSCGPVSNGVREQTERNGHVCWHHENRQQAHSISQGIFLPIYFVYLQCNATKKNNFTYFDIFGTAGILTAFVLVRNAVLNKTCDRLFAQNVSGAA